MLSNQDEYQKDRAIGESSMSVIQIARETTVNIEAKLKRVAKIKGNKQYEHEQKINKSKAQ